MIFGSNLLFNLYIEEITPIITPTNSPTNVGKTAPITSGPTKRKLIKGNINNIYKLY